MDVLLRTMCRLYSFASSLNLAWLLLAISIYIYSRENYTAFAQRMIYYQSPVCTLTTSRLLFLFLFLRQRGCKNADSFKAAPGIALSHFLSFERARERAFYPAKFVCVCVCMCAFFFFFSLLVTYTPLFLYAPTASSVFL